MTQTLDIDGLPRLTDVIKEFSLSAKKTLGQNFLLDFNITRKIARLAGAGQGYDFLEIGPGPGGLTRALLHEGAKSVTVIEKDERCLELLQKIQAHYPDKMRIVIGDALEIDIKELMKDKPQFHIAANLPYNISSEILTSWLCEETWPPIWKSATLMYQKEFADRLKAKSSTKEYGRLSILTQWRAEVEKLMDVHPSNFTPPPRVMSCVIKVKPKEKIKNIEVKKLEAITKATFGQRRKMLRQSLKSVTSNPEELCLKANISPEKRADHLSVDEYLNLAECI